MMSGLPYGWNNIENICTGPTLRMYGNAVRLSIRVDYVVSKLHVMQFS